MIHYKPWYPTADKLQLPYVPETAKGQVRKILVPVLAKMKADKSPIRESHCWPTSQTVLLLAKSPRVKYVEGVWLGGCTGCTCGGAVQHGWNLVDDYVVDLTEELYFRKDRKFAPEREPHTIFTAEEVAQHYKDHPNSNLVISRAKWLFNGGFATLPAQLKATVGHWQEKEWAEVGKLFFNETTMRLRNRLRKQFRGVKSA